MLRKTTFIFILCLGCVGLFGCSSMAPKYSRPAAPIPDSWPSGAAYNTASLPGGAATAASLKWRDFFNDEKMQSVIELALQNNRDLRIAALNIEKARAMYGIQKAEIFPIVGVSAGGSQQRLPADVSGAGKVVTAEQYNVSFGVSSWELDFFGRVASLKEQALENYLSTEQAQRSAKISLVSAVANAYLLLAADLEKLQFSEKTLQTQSTSFNLIKRRYETGIFSELDLRQAQTRVEAARVDVVSNTRAVALDQNLLNLLVGQNVPANSLPSSLFAARKLLTIAAGLPSDVLLQRPDILQAENRLQAANANIGAARADFFPRITLTTGVGTISSELSGLFKSGSGTWAFAPRIDLPIFDFGRRKNNLDAALAETKIATAQYEKAIQTAFREVSDSLAVLGTADSQVKAQESLIKASQQTYRLAELRYQKGVDNYLPTLDAQRSLYAAESGLISLRLARVNALVSLYKALGGGE
ncbi:MAG: efflux transporter outer membrane subunit [Syntrophales bacterium]